VTKQSPTNVDVIASRKTFAMTNSLEVSFYVGRVTDLGIGRDEHLDLRDQRKC